MFKKKQRRFLELIYKENNNYVYIICIKYTIIGTLVQYEL